MPRENKDPGRPARHRCTVLYNLLDLRKQMKQKRSGLKFERFSTSTLRLQCTAMRLDQCTLEHGPGHLSLAKHELTDKHSQA